MEGPPGEGNNGGDCTPRPCILSPEGQIKTDALVSSRKRARSWFRWPHSLRGSLAGGINTRRNQKREYEEREPRSDHLAQITSPAPPADDQQTEPDRTFSWMMRNVGPPPAPLPRTARDKAWVRSRRDSMSWLQRSQRRSGTEEGGSSLTSIPSPRSPPKENDSRKSQLKWLRGLEDDLIRSLSSFTLSKRRS